FGDCGYELGFSILEENPAFTTMIEVEGLTCPDELATVTVVPSVPNLDYEYNLVGINNPTFVDDSVLVGLTPGDYQVVTRIKGSPCTDTLNFTLAPTALAFTASATAVSDLTCFQSLDGSFRIDVTGEQAGQDYEFMLNEEGWRTDSLFTELAAGTYTVSVRQAGANCSRELSITLREPEPITFSPMVTNASCGQATGRFVFGAPSGGTPPYRYSINGGESFQLEASFDELAPGEYQALLRDANGCEAEETFTISAEDELPEIAELINPNCFAPGSVRLTVVPGAEVYQLFDLAGELLEESTTPAFTELGPGDYVILVEGACTFRLPFGLTGDFTAFAEVSITAISDCGAGTGQLVINTGTTALEDYTFRLEELPELTPPFTGLEAGDYTLIGSTEQGCEETFRVEVPRFEEAIGVDALLLSTPNCTSVRAGSFAVQYDGPAELEYQFSLDGLTYSADSVFTDLSSGSYDYFVRVVGPGCVYQGNIEVPFANDLEVEVAETDIFCGANAGAVEVTVSNGLDPIRYSLDGGTTFQLTGIFDDLPTGDYEVLVRDGGSCTTTVSFTIRDGREALMARVESAPPTCADNQDGRAAIVVESDNGPFTFSWPDGSQDSVQTDLVVGTYAVTVTSRFQCTTIVNFELTQSPLVITAAILDTGCDDSGRIDLAVSGGTAPYSYLWAIDSLTPSISGLAEGNYAVSVTDANGCTETAQYAVGSLEPLYVPIGDRVFCRSSRALIVPEFPVQDISWSTSDGLLLGMDDTLAVSETLTVNVRGRDSLACPFQEVLEVREAEDILLAGFLVAERAVAGDTVVLVENSSYTPDDIDWAFTGPAPVVPVRDSLNQHWFRFDSVGVYTATLVATAGDCEDFVTKTITIVRDSTELEPEEPLF
ncbi:MAG: hypothetical protein AAF597_06530, partial [Bacteroidota bacterium]